MAAVLVVDDEKGPRESLRLIFEPYLHVLTADAGEKAIETLREFPIDVVTLDLKMPGMSGANTLARLREIDPEVEVVVVTGFGSYESAVDVLRLRATDYITKPFEARRVLDVVRRAAERRRARRHAATTELARNLAEDLRVEVDAYQAERFRYGDDEERAALNRIQLLSTSVADLLQKACREPTGALPEDSVKGHG